MFQGLEERWPGLPIRQKNVGQKYSEAKRMLNWKTIFLSHIFLSLLFRGSGSLGAAFPFDRKMGDQKMVRGRIFLPFIFLPCPGVFLPRRPSFLAWQENVRQKYSAAKKIMHWMTIFLSVIFLSLLFRGSGVAGRCISL